MSPLREDDLRTELWYAQPGVAASTANDLAGAVIRRGRGVRRRRTVAAGVAVVAVAAASVFGLTQLTAPQRAVPITSMSPSPAASPTPSAVPTPTAQPSPSATPSAGPATSTTPSSAGGWTDTTRWPGAFGDLGDFRLLHDGVPATAMETAWEPSDELVLACDAPQTFPSLRTLTAGRQIGSTGPESYLAEGVLVFATEDDARAFLHELAAATASCAVTSSDPDYQTRTASAAPEGVGDEALVWSTWTERTIDGVTGATPGGSATLYVRSGRAVTMASASGEFVGDPWQTGHAEPGLREVTDHALPQMCRWRSGGC